MRRAVALAFVAISLLGGCNSDEPEPLGTVAATAAVPLNLAPTVEDFVVYGRNSVQIGNQAVVLGADVGTELDGDGPFLSTGFELGVGTFATVDPAYNLLAAAVRLKNKCTVGDVQALTVDNQNCSTGAMGAWPSMPSFPPALLASPTAEPLTVANGGTVQLGSDEARGDVWLKKDGLLRLEGGVYHFENVQLDQGAWIQALAPVSIRVAGRILAKKRNRIGPAEGTGLSAGDVRLDVWGENGVPGNPHAKPFPVELGWETKVQALILAPYGTLQLDKGVRATGAFFARDVDVGLEASVQFEDGFHGGTTCNPADCSDGNPCTQDVCVEGACEHAPLMAGAACPDGNVCNGDETCDGSGQCLAGTAPTLDDDNPCTVDSCDATSGVHHAPVTAGAACPDDTVCNGEETCDGAGQCVAGTAPTLDDDNPCTVDSCDASSGVQHAPVSAGTACPDGDLCDGDETCDGAGQCVAGTALTVDDSNPCTSDSCDPNSGVLHALVAVGTACPDGDLCNGNEACNASGQCVAGTAPTLDDNNPCTVDSCDPANGVSHTPVADGTSCDNANACDGDETCRAGHCLAGLPPSFSDGNPCTSDGCDPATGVFHEPTSQGVPCSDGNKCNGEETCDGAGACVAGTAPAVDDTNPCTVDSCEPVQGVLHLPALQGTACADSDVCNGQEACDGAGQCMPGQAPVVDDGNPCTDDVCDATGGVNHSPRSVGSSCTDGNACNGNETCDGAGACLPGSSPVLDDGNPCTKDECDPSSGVTHVAQPAGTWCTDDNPCNGFELCDDAGACVASAVPEVDDDNACTDDLCDPAQGVIHVPVAANTSCEDGDLCNGYETCDGAGTCVPGMPVDVDDGDPCSEDLCDIPTGTVTHVAKDEGESCSADPCASGDTCQAGACVPGPAPLADDGNPCTIDVCDPETGGLLHYPHINGTPCNLNACEGGGTCEGGECVSGPVPTVDDDNACTIDVCDPETGEVTHVLVPAGTSCSDGDFCNGVEACDAAGACLAAAPPVIDDGELCTIDRCDPVTGEISHEPVEDGTPCSEDMCGAPAFCDEGECPSSITGPARSVGLFGLLPLPEPKEENPCRPRICDPTTGKWTYDVLPDWTPCPDADLCNGDEVCVEGGCGEGFPPTVDDNNPCTTDSCDPVLGVQHVPLAEGTQCTPGDACYSPGTCDAVGNCGGYELQPVDDGNPCTVDSCDPSTGTVAHVPQAWASCSDGNFCNGEEYCEPSGTCVAGWPPWIDDHNPCTVDACDPDEGVSHAALPAGSSCGDGDVCNGIETCDNGAVCQAGSAPQVDDGNPCTVDSCDPVVGVQHVPSSAATSCSDGNACNGSETCDGAGNCAASLLPFVNDGNPCTLDSCDAVDGVTHAPRPAGASCADDDACNGFETCDGAGACKAGAVPVLEDGDPCTDDICVSHVGVEHRPRMDASCASTAYAWAPHAAGRPSPRDGAAVAVDPTNDRMLVVGGENAGVALGDAWSLSLSSHGWARFYDELPARTGAALSRGPGDAFILFGGMRHARGGDTVLDDTWVLESGSQRWTALAPSNAPSPRAHASVAFDEVRDRVLLVGGHDTAGASLSDVWAWDGSSWMEVSTQNAPTGRSHAAAAVDSQRDVLVLVGGGHADGGGVLDPLDECWELDLPSSVWSPCPGDGPTARLGHAMAYDAARGRMVLLGGTGSEPGAFAETWEYDGSGWSVAPTPIQAPPRVGHSLVYDPASESVLLFGGTTYSESGLVTPAFDDGWAYDVGVGWRPRGGTVAPALVGQTLVYDSRGGDLVTFGEGYYPALWRYDGARDTWYSEGAVGSSEPRRDIFFDPVAQQLSRLATGLYPVWGPDPAAQVQVRAFDGTDWTTRDCTNSPRVLGFGFTLDSKRGVLITFGGRFNETNEGFTNAIWELDLATCSWDAPSTSDSRPPKREEPLVAFDAHRDVVVIYGGRSGTWLGQLGGTVLDDTWEYDGTAWTRRVADGDPSPGLREGATMVYDVARERIVLFGGEDPSGALLDDTWEYDGQSGSWEQRVVAGPNPPPRVDAAMTYDARMGRTVLLGGEGEGAAQSRWALADLWAWDGTEWKQLGSHASPPARSGASAVTLSSGRTILFGGVSGDGQRTLLQDTWKWENGLWSSFDPGVLTFRTNILGSPYAVGRVPAGRAGHAFAAGDDGVAVLFGGEGDSGLLDDTWVWKEGEWSEPIGRAVSSSGVWVSVPKRTEAALAAIGQGGFLLFGGRAEDGSVLGDTWQLFAGVSKADWYKTYDGYAAPPARSSHAMVRDPQTGHVLLFGGRDAQGKALRDLWEYDPSVHAAERWTKLSPSISPPARFGHQLTVDLSRSKIVLTGGVGDDADTLFDDVWEWDSGVGNWTLRSPGARMQARAGHAALFDPQMEAILAFGGLAYADEGAAVSSFGDTWTLPNASSADGSPARLPHGTPCSADAACDSGRCVDGVCCQSACDQQCEACNEPGHAGECVAVSGPPRGDRPSCGTKDPCVGTCDAVHRDRCLPIAVGEVCRADTCDDGVRYANAHCSAAHVCEAEETSCGGFACQGDQCRTMCNSVDGCASGHICQSTLCLGAYGYYTCASECTDCEWPCAHLVSFELSPSTFQTPVRRVVPSGTTVTLTAEASTREPLPPGDELLFRFTIGSAGQAGTHPCGDYGTSNTCVFDVGPPGDSWATVEVKHASSKAAYADRRSISIEVTP
jgi:Dictyostelium (slime mold) repeat/Galactose oxidase, central domain